MNRIISRFTGKIMGIKFPKFFQRRINTIFVKIFSIDLSEFKYSDSYTSLQDLFTRSLERVREFSTVKSDIIAPTDSKIIQYGKLKSSILLQVKGVKYSVEDFLGNSISEGNLQKIKNGSFINFYLSPKDYHHFHAPIDIYIQKIIHIPGNLYPVKESFIRKREVFSKNERVLLECKTEMNQNLLYFVLIGALNVGNIKIIKEPKIQTNSSKKSAVTTYIYKTPLFLKKGEDIGYFSFGSSVVMISEKNSLQYYSDLLNKSVKFGDVIGNLF